MNPIHPVPECTKLKNRSQCPRDKDTSDPALEAATAGTLAGALVRFIAGYDPQDRTFSRTSRSFQIFGGLELSWMHAARSNAEELLLAIATQLPTAAVQAFGSSAAASMRSPEFVSTLVDTFNGYEELPPGTEWLAAGWQPLSSRDDVQRVIAEWYFGDIPSKVMRWMQDTGLTSRRTLAAGVRARNTSGTQLEALKDSVSQYGEAEGTTRFLQAYKGGEYLEILDSWPEFQGSIDRWPRASDLGWSAGGVPAELMGQFSQIAQNPTVRTAGYIVAGVLGALVIAALVRAAR